MIKEHIKAILFISFIAGIGFSGGVVLLGGILQLIKNFANLLGL